MSVTTLSRVTSYTLSQCPDPTRPDPTHSLAEVVHPSFRSRGKTDEKHSAMGGGV